MQILTKLISIDHLASPAKTSAGELAKKLRETGKEFLTFAEAPFKAEVVIVQTAEDDLE
tara:strand:- start:166 stop:342 length:177 start_codon:yes stop_codon:yes gene_type:complete